jgi:acyl transferase domain-containing protein
MQRWLLEVTWEALEDAGLVPEQLAGSPTGVYMGVFTEDTKLFQLGEANRELIGPHTGTGTAMTMAGNRLSYWFDLRGPSMSVDTACSSSLICLHLACQSLWSGETTLALVGGANAMFTPGYTIAESKAGMLSPTGRCKTFDSSADGYVRGEGAGVVVLKPLARAAADGDRVHAVILSTAANQDGRTSGITVPSGEAQQELMREAFRLAGVSPGRVRYMEAHGTGTPVGDPIEANALGAVLGIECP